MRTMLVSSPVDGARKVEWDPTDAAQVEKVKEEFDKLIEHNFAFKTTPGGKEQIREFDPAAEEIHIRANLVGG